MSTPTSAKGSRFLLDMLNEASEPRKRWEGRVLLHLSDRDVTGTVIGLGLMHNEVRVRWDDTDEVTHIGLHRLEKVL